MRFVLFILGLLIAVGGFLAGFTSLPTSAPQQAVQAIYFAIGALGLVIAGLGAVVEAIVAAREALTESAIKTQAQTPATRE